MKTILTFSFVMFMFSFTIQVSGQWQQTSAPIKYVEALQANEEVILASMDDSTFLISSDHGETWALSGTGLPNLKMNYIYSVPGTRTFYASSSDGIFKTENNGGIWTELATPLENPGIVYYYNGYLFVSAGAGANEGLNRSADDGQTWESLNNELFDTYIRCLANDDEYLYAGKWKYSSNDTRGVFKSSDNGNTWDTTGYTGKGYQIDIDYMVTTGEYIYASCYSHVIVSNDQGASWSYTEWFGDIPIIGIIAVDNYIVTCSYSCPYKMVVGNNVWESWTEGISTTGATTFISDGTYIYCGTYNDGIWRRPVDELTTGINEKQCNETCLSIYPNPAAGILYFEVSINTRPFDLKIIDVHGRVVCSKKSFSQKSIDVSELQSGIYFLSLQSENEMYNARFVKK